MKTKRIDITVLDIVERVKLPQDIRIIQNGFTLYSGGVSRIPSVLLNEKVLFISTTDYCPLCLKIEIE